MLFRSGLIIGSADHILYRLLLGVLIGVMVAVSILPVIAIECLSKKGYIFSIILSFIYASASFAIVFAMSNVLSPLSAVFRWALPHMTTGPTYGLDDWFLRDVYKRQASRYPISVVSGVRTSWERLVISWRFVSSACRTVDSLFS